MSNSKKEKDFEKAMSFIYEIDGLKSIYRQTKITTEDRYENDAEHSWHISIMAHTLKEFFDDSYNINIERAVKMLLLHDVVELYAGDTYCYDEKAAVDKFEREMKSAERIFGMLPDALGKDYMRLWLEFDNEETDDAIFASILDKIQPLLLNYKNDGEGWKQNGIKKSQVEKRMNIALTKGPEILRKYVGEIIEKSVEKGYLLDK